MSDTPREQLIRIATDALNHMGDAELRGYVLTQNLLLSVPAKRRAVHLKAMNPEISDANIAVMVGVDRSTLYRSEEYRRLKEAMTPTPSTPCGSFDKDGNIEAFD